MWTIHDIFIHNANDYLPIPQIFLAFIPTFGTNIRDRVPVAQKNTHTTWNA